MNEKLELGDLIIDNYNDKYVVLTTMDYPVKYTVANISRSFVSECKYDSLDVIINDYFGSYDNIKIIKTYNKLF